MRDNCVKRDIALPSKSDFSDKFFSATTDIVCTYLLLIVHLFMSGFYPNRSHFILIHMVLITGRRHGYVTSVTRDLVQPISIFFLICLAWMCPEMFHNRCQWFTS